MYRDAHQQYYFDQFPMTATTLNQPKKYVVMLLIDFVASLYAEAFSNCQMHPEIKVYVVTSFIIVSVFIGVIL